MAGVHREGRPGPLERAAGRAGRHASAEGPATFRDPDRGEAMRTRDGAGPLAPVALLVAGLLCLSGCGRLLLGIPAEVGVAAAEERSLDDAIDDLTIRLALNAVFLREDASLYRAVSFSVVEGRALLKGSVPTPADRARALALTRPVAGVREVIDELQVGAGGGVAGYLRNTWISAQLKTRVLIDAAILHVNYDIETVDGVVHLMGIAQDGEELARVVAHARAIGGVRRVVKHVVVKDRRHPPPMPGG